MGLRPLGIRGQKSRLPFIKHLVIIDKKANHQPGSLKRTNAKFRTEREAARRTQKARNRKRIATQRAASSASSALKASRKQSY